MNIESIVDGLRLKEVKVAVLGVGHVGLPTALGFAELGWSVIGADSDTSKIEQIRRGEAPFFEPGLDHLLAHHKDNPNFQMISDVGEAVRQATVLFLCVGTPQKAGGEADLSEIERLACLIARNLNGYKLIVEKSTVPAITGRWVKRTIVRHSRKSALYQANCGDGVPHSAGDQNETAFEVASNPEFLQEGRAIENFFKPDRVVCGVNSERARRILEVLYEPLNCRMVFSDITTAELIKHAANAFLTTKISFINMVADICEAVGADVTKVAEGIGLDSRIGSAFLNAGLGYGGYCFPKDVAAFKNLAQSHNVDASLLSAVQSVNDSRVERLLKKVKDALWIIRGKTIAVLGLAFKAGTDDIREAPALKVVEALIAEGARVKLYDPQAMPNAMKVLSRTSPAVHYAKSAWEAAEDSDALLVLTEWDEFRAIDPETLHEVMRVAVVIDGRNIFDPATMLNADIDYHCFGRAQAHSHQHRPRESMMQHFPDRRAGRQLSVSPSGVTTTRSR